MLQNASLLAIVAVDTAENEPFKAILNIFLKKICQHLAKLRESIVDNLQNFEFGAVQRFLILVDFEKPCKMSLCSLS